MDIISRIFKALCEIARLARTLFTNGVHIIVLCAQSRTALAAENLFLRKQLSFYLERKVAPRRFDNVSRFGLALLSHWFAWKDALMSVKAEDLHWLASCWIPAFLAMEVTARPTTDTGGTARTHPRDGARQSGLGRGASR